MVDSIETIDNDKYRLRISDMEGDRVIDTTLISDTMKLALEELQWSIKVRKGGRKNTGCIRGSNTSDTVKSQWLLVLPRHSQFSTVRLQTLIK